MTGAAVMVARVRPPHQPRSCGSMRAGQALILVAEIDDRVPPYDWSVSLDLERRCREAGLTVASVARVVGAPEVDCCGL